MCMRTCGLMNMLNYNTYSSLELSSIHLTITSCLLQATICSIVHATPQHTSTSLTPVRDHQYRAEGALDYCEEMYFVQAGV